jgi:opacity protein-like surface antigen
VKIFAGAGVGIARIKTKFEFNFDDKEISMPIAKSKISNTFSYALHLGASTEFTTGIHGELVYSYRDMGKTKNTKQEGEIIPNTSVGIVKLTNEEYKKAIILDFRQQEALE